MRNQFFNMAMIAVTALALTFSSCKKDDPDPVTPPAEVNIPDAKLRAFIKTTLGLGENDVINIENIKGLDTLDIAGEDDLTGNLSEIADLTGLEAATELVYVRFGGTQVTNLAPIGGLKKVQYLRLNNTQVSDLTPISGYTTLTYFNANTVTTLTNIAPLSQNTGLQEMILRDVPMGNAGLAVIRNFTSLYRLNARSTGITNIQPLADMMGDGALLDTTPGAAAAGGATLDLRGNSVDCSVIGAYTSQITNLEGC